MPKSRLHENGRLGSRPQKTPVGAAPVGLWVLGTEAGPTEGYLYVPAGYRKENPAPLVLLLHGAGEDARDGLALLRGQADQAGLLLLATASCGPTWDLILNGGRHGQDIAAIDLALGYAFSPGFLAPTGKRGSPRVFVSHGTHGGWLPIDCCGRRIVRGWSARATRCATGSSKAATWSRQMSRAKRQAGSPANAKAPRSCPPPGGRALRGLSRRHRGLRARSPSEEESEKRHPAARNRPRISRARMLGYLSAFKVIGATVNIAALLRGRGV